MPNWKTYESSVRLLSAILAAHPDLKLNYAEISRAFGGDCTRWAIDNRFRSLKTDAKRIVDALANGQDPGNLDIPSKGREIADYYGDCTKYALDHRFRDIKKTAAAMRAAGPGNPIADKYEQGVTPKAVSTRFERLKKEPDWLGNDANANGDASSAAPKAKNPRTPKKKPAKKVLKEDDVDDEEDEDEADISPSKFTPGGLNKTKGGRVTKSTPRKGGAKVPKYVQEKEEDEEDEMDEMDEDENAGAVVVKHESNDYGASFSAINGHANGGGYADEADEDEEEYHPASSGQQYGNGYDDTI